MARPTKIIFASDAYVIVSHPIHIGTHADIMVTLRPSSAHRGDDKGAATTATKGTILPRIFDI